MLCCSPFEFCKDVREVHNCWKDYLSEDCSQWIRKLIAAQESQKTIDRTKGRVIVIHPVS